MRNGHHLFFITAFLLGFGLSNGASARDLHFKSTNRRTALVELFSSEGCSSCPPAWTWLHESPKKMKLWRDYVPVAFHVDYWDHLGWKDRFDSPEFTERQKEHAAEWNNQRIYTPGFVLNGEEWKNWGESAAALPAPSSGAGILEVTIPLKSSAKGLAHVEFTEGEGPKHQNVIANVALLGSGIKSDVKAGENEGGHFIHDFVVLKFKKIQMKKSRDKFQAEFDPLTADPALLKDVPQTQWAVWISADGSLTPLQVVGGENSGQN